MSEFVQIGVTALKDPLTGGYKPAVPLFVRAADADQVACIGDPFQDFAKLFAGKFREYAAACAEAGETV